MDEFLNKLYGYQYFSLYLIIAIVVLVILFFIILFAGRKDKKEREIEATKKLQQINGEFGFKEEATEQKVETEPVKDLQNDTIMMPIVEEANMSMTEEAPSIEPTVEAPTPVEPIINVEPTINVEPVINPEPIKEPELEPVVQPDIQPIVQPEVEINNDLEEKTLVLEPVEEKPLVFEEDKVEPVVQSVEEQSVPTFDFDSILKNIEESSSKTEEIPKESIPSPELEPKIPEVEVTDIPVSDWNFPTMEETTPVEGTQPKEVFSSVYVPTPEEKPKASASGDLDFELPALKKEEKVEGPVLRDYNLDDLSGEIYSIK